MNKKEAIYQATIDLVISEGIHNTPMSKIAKKAGISVGTIYLYFKNKEDLIGKLYMDLKKRMGEAIHKVDIKNLDTEAIFKAYWIGLYNYFSKDPKALQYMEQLRFSTYISAKQHEEAEIYYMPIINFFAEAMQMGKIKRMSIPIVASMQHAVVSNLVYQKISRLAEVNVDELESVCQSCWDGLKKI